MTIYYDNASTTPALPCACGQFWGNPSSPHALGISAERELAAARQTIAGSLECRPEEIIFTSGGTESNNLALIGTAMASRRKNFTFFAQPWEHPSVLQPLEYIKAQGLANVVLAPHGQWHSSGPCLAAISHVNHETGDINDVQDIAMSLKQNASHAIIFVDGVQGFCKHKIDLSSIDMYSFSAHKCHGPTGVGGLVLRNNIRITPLLYGGGQENKVRPGTENLTGIQHMAEVVKTLGENEVAKVKSIIMELASELPNVHINAMTSNVSPYILNMSFVGIKGEPFVHLLSEKGLYASMGAACQSRKNTKTALEIMGFSKERAQAAIRFSFSCLNTPEEAIAAKEIIKDCFFWLHGVDRGSRAHSNRKESSI